MRNEPTRRLAEQLRGDVTQLPDLPDLPDDESATDATRLAMNLLGSAAKLAGHWVALSAPHVISQLQGFPLNPLMHPTTWMKLFAGNSKAAQWFREAEGEGLVVTSSDETGYYYEPTQALADRMLGATTTASPEA